jgi:hypothetical protein
MNLKNYTVDDSFLTSIQKPIRLTTPLKSQSFMAHPTAVLRNVYTIYIDNKWYVINPKLIKKNLISQDEDYCLSDIYFGVLEDGDYFLLPVTFDDKTKRINNSYTDSLLEMIEEARTGWVKKKGTRNKEHIWVPQEHITKKVTWIDFEDAINQLPREHYIETMDDF